MKSLPYEVLMMIALLATQEDRNTAVRLASICRDFANMYVTPSIDLALFATELQQSDFPPPLSNQDDSNYLPSCDL